MRMLIGVIALSLATLVTSCASASPPLVETEYITQIVEARPAMTAAMAADPAVCPAVRPAENGDLTDGYVDCAVIAASNAGQVRDLQRLVLGDDAVPPDR